MEVMIFDRTQKDVDYAKEHSNSNEFLKGTLNYTDLNRIEKNYLEINEKLRILGRGVDLNPVKTFVATLYEELTETYEYYQNMTYEELLNEDKWEMTDLIFIENINQIRENVRMLQETTNVSTTNIIEFVSTLNYTQLNILEKILYDIYAHIEESIKSFKYTGTFYCGEDIIAY